MWRWGLGWGKGGFACVVGICFVLCAPICVSINLGPELEEARHCEECRAANL